MKEKAREPDFNVVELPLFHALDQVEGLTHKIMRAEGQGLLFGGRVIVGSQHQDRQDIENGLVGRAKEQEAHCEGKIDLSVGGALDGVESG